MHRPNDYRPDIDGLRAVAVVSVVLFHYGFTRLRGGYVGVDVFFVISGFLITRLIVADLEAGRFSFGRFYLRRARRLLPALFVTLAASLVAGSLLLIPEHLERQGRSLVAALGSVSNILFWQESGYFDTGGHAKPLLHTWSLAVEEQFYLVWPLVAVSLWTLGRGRALAAVLVVAALASLVAAERWLEIDRVAAFYLAPFRVTELAIGALCVWAVRTAPRSVWASDLIVAGGLAAIVFSMLAYGEQTPFPGVSALVPCLGTAAVIYAGRQSRVGALLTNRVAVGTGLISYSLYLVHWPLYVYYRYWKLQPLTRLDRVGLIVAAFALAALMYHWVERPFRVAPTAAALPGGRRSSGGVRFAAACAGVAILLALPAAWAWQSGGWRWRVPEEVSQASGELRTFSAARDSAIRSPSCHMSEGFEGFAPTFSRCLEIRDGVPNVLVMGDSHAADLWAALRLAYPGTNFLQATGAGCSPVESYFASPRNDCRRLLEVVKRDFPGLARVDGIAMSARWTGRLEELTVEVDHYRARGIPVVVFGPVAEYEPTVRQLLHHHGRRHGFERFAERHRVPRVSRLDREMGEVMARAGIGYVSSIHVFCGGGPCPLESRDGKLLVQDYGHWGPDAFDHFARRLGERYDSALALFKIESDVEP